MKTLYVSDLDGTLLRNDQRTSDYTNMIINKLVKEGMLFSYATARSYVTAQKVTEGLNAEIPLIVYNGAFIINNKTGRIIISNFFDSQIYAVIKDLINNNIYPMVYSFIDGIEKMSFVKNKCSKGMKEHIKSRKGDKRANPLENQDGLYNGDIFYITCIDDRKKLEPLYEKYRNSYHCVFQEDIYTNEQWLEIMPLNTSKANAVKELKKYLNCKKSVVFGDGINDIDMFEISDECYAVKNAADELKKIATQIIDSNNNDGVAKWLENNFTSNKK